MRLGGVCIYHGHKLYALLLFFQFVVNTGVVAAKRAHTNDRYADCTFVRQVTDFLRACPLSQRL